MYPCIAEISRTKASDSSLLPSWGYTVPSTKLRNVVCVKCQSKFYVPDLSNLNLNGLNLKGILIPLLLDCGHPVCSKCAKREIMKTCPLCKMVLNNNLKFPLNLYTLGLIISSYHSPLENDDDEFLFCHKLSSQSRQIAKQGCCHECGNQANVNCPQCMVLYCHCCYAKIHGRALQNHTQIPVFDGGPGNPAVILNKCSPTCSEALSYFCNDCNLACCSDCTLRSHKLHHYIPLSEKNQTLLPEFNKTYRHIEETLQRVYQSKEKVKSAIASNSYKLQNSEIIETSITQHFAHLHGVLQNMEAKLMNQLHEQGDCLKNNLEDIEIQLLSQEEKLKLTLQIATYAKDTFHKVDIRNAINILMEMADLPCHLLFKDVGKSHKALFTVDDSIVEAIEDHCTVVVPQVSSFSLVRKDELPKNYIISPLPKKSRTIVDEFDRLKTRLNNYEMVLTEILDSLPSMVPIIQPSNATPTTAFKMEDKEQESVSEYKVQVTYVVNPSLFFIQKMSSKPKFLQLQKDLMEYGNDEQNLKTSINLKQDDMCIVKQKKSNNEWYRAYVNAVITTDDNKTLYNVTYIDYGYEECNIEAWRVQEIAEHHRALPPQAIRCSLHGVVPKNIHWTNASTNDFLKLTSEAECTMSIIKSTPDILYVDLCVIPKNSNMGPQSMISTMKIMDYARLDKQSSRQSSKTTYVYTQEELLLNRALVVNVGWVDSPDKIYVSKACRKNKFLKLRDELNEYYEKEASMIETPLEGLPCAVQTEDGTWQRCEITEIIDENRVRVFCVDWGCTLIRDCNTLREIPHEYTLFKAQAIRISLMYIMSEPDGTWKPEALVTLLTLLENAQCVIVSPRKKIEDGYFGCIYDDGSDISRQLKTSGVVNDYVVSTGYKFKRFTRKSRSAFKNIPSMERSDSPIKDLYVSYDVEDKKSVKDEAPKDPFKVEVRIQRVMTPDCIYVAQAEYEQAIARLMSAMQMFYDTYLSEPRDNWNEGALCTVYSAKDKSYFRAKILKINSPMNVLVYFYDMGIEETVTMKDIQVLHSKFAKEMTYCFKVKLAGILPCGGSSTWPSLSCNTLSEITQDNAHCKFYITKLVQEDVIDDAIPVELWVKQSKIPGPLAPTKIEINSINRMLVDKGVALPIKNYFAKADSVLAIDFKQQLESSCLFALSEQEVTWLNKDLNENEMNDTIVSHKNELWNSSNGSITLLASNTDLKHKACDSTNRECAVKISDWVPPHEIREEVFHAIPTYVDNKCIVYLHAKKYNADVLHYIETELQIHYKNIKINKEKKWKIGELCIARYHQNRKWYRGRIVQTLGNILQVEFVDYGNVEDCEIEHVTDHIRLGHIPVQCTKCIISGLRPANGKWMLHDLDRIHALLVDQECKVSILQRQSTHLIVSVTLLRPWKCDLLLYLANHMDMSIKIERKEWNDSSDISEGEDSNLDSTRDVVVEGTISDYEKLCIADTSKSEIDIEENIGFNDHVISSNLSETLKTELLDKIESKILSDESILSIDTLNPLTCSTPQPSEEEDRFVSYKRLIIPQETKYIELILCCNRDPVTSYAQLGENNDDIFSNELHEYYLQYEIVMSELQADAYHQPLIKSITKGTPCIAKFTDGMWYRCSITNSEQIPNSRYVRITLYYVDYGNHESKKWDPLSKNYDLRVPKEEWLDLPAMAIKCTFWGLNFVSNNIDLLALKLNEIYNQAVVARVKKINEGSNLVAEIYKDKTCKKLFYADLIKEGLYQFDKPKED